MDRRMIFAGLFTITLASAILSFTLFSRKMVQSSFFPAQRNRVTLIVDPGHGGEDGGAVSVSGVSESGINLEIASKCCEVSGLYGLETIPTRCQDVSLASSDAETLREKKRSDLQRRVELVNRTDHAWLLSIHQNKYSSPSSDGAQVFFRPDEASEQWGVHTQDLLRQTLKPDNDRLAKEIPDQIYLMSHINCPAILVECGFLSNPEEERLLQNQDYQRRIAAVLIASFLQNIHR